MPAATEDRETRMELVSSRLGDLLTTREALIQQLADRDAILASVRLEYHGLLNEGAAVSSLPDDILAIIFEVAHESQPHRKTPFVELEISHVCKHWRDVSLCLPRLWANILCGWKQVGLRRNGVYLQRSQQSPIFLDIYMFAHYDKHIHSQDLDAFYRLIAPHMPRCNVLHFSCFCLLSCWVRLLEIVRAVKLPILSHVQLCSLRDEVPEKVVAGASPLLTTLQLINTDIRFFPFSLASITHFQLYGAQASAAIDVREGLLHMPCLIHLEVYANYDTPWVEEGWEVRLLRLRILSIGSMKPIALRFSFILLLMKALRMPSLEIVSLDGYVEPFVAYDVDEPGVKSIQRFPSLRQLILRASPVPLPHLVIILPSIVDLTYITVATHSTLQDIIHLLEVNPPDESPTFWPHLSTITLPMMKSSELEKTPQALMNRRNAWCPRRALFVPNVPADFDMSECVEVVEYAGAMRDPTNYFKW